MVIAQKPLDNILLPRKIGDQTVSAIGFGTMGDSLQQKIYLSTLDLTVFAGLSIAYGKVDSDEERMKILDAVLAGGCNHIDT